MALTLSQVLQTVFRQLGQAEETTATGGSTTTAIDTKLGDRYGDDDIKDGALFVVRDAAGANAAPEGQFSLIASYTQSTNTVTTRDTLTAAIGSGDKVMLTNASYPLQTMISLVNDALQDIGTIQYVDTSTVTPTATYTEYQWDITLKYTRPVRVAIQGNTSNSSDNQWMILHDWELQPAGPGADGKIIFHGQPPTGHLIQIVYETLHPVVYAYNDTIAESIHPQLIAALTVEKALEWQNSRTQGTDQFLLQRWNDAKVRSREMMSRYKPYKAQKRQHKYLIIGQPDVEDTFTYPDPPI